CVREPAHGVAERGVDVAVAGSGQCGSWTPCDRSGVIKADTIPFLVSRSRAVAPTAFDEGPCFDQKGRGCIRGASGERAYSGKSNCAMHLDFVSGAGISAAIEVSLIGSNLLMVGPPGSGKSMLAARLPGVLPPLEPAEEALELGMIQSVGGGLRG